MNVMNSPLDLRSRDDHVRLLLDQRAARADLHGHGRFPSLSEFSDSPSVYSHPHFSPRPSDRAPHDGGQPFRFPQSSHPYSPSLAEPRSPISDRERLNIPTASSLDLEDDPRLSSDYGSMHDGDDSSPEEDGEEEVPRINMYGPKMRFHSPAPWEEDEEELSRDSLDEPSKRSKKKGESGKKGWGLSRGTSEPRPSNDSSTSSRPKQSFETSSTLSAAGALAALAQASMSSTSLAINSGTPKLAFVALLAVNCILWSQSKYSHVGTRSPFLASIAKRSFTEGPLSVFSEECHPLSVPLADQCAHVRDACAMERTFLSIGYLESYFCSELSIRPLVFVGYALWLGFLFSTLGISASDFFCPNLGTIAHLLGLDENVAGVTFLAFGNGSPDMFATFSAMRSNSGGLAIGELLGAAAFITSCVVGSMCIIKPFKVNRGSFLRDVGFFTVAVSILLVVLWDNKLEAWEAAAMIVLYAVYVTSVIVASYWGQRQEKRRQYESLMRSEYADEEPYHDDETLFDPLPSPTPDTLHVPSSHSRARAISHPEPPRLGLQTDLPPRPRTRSTSPSSSPNLSHMHSFSLVRALEFRRVVSSLNKDSASARLSVFESPLTPYGAPHYRHTRTTSGSRTPSRTPHRQSRDLEQDPWDAALGVPLDERSPPTIVTSTISEEPRDAGELPSLPLIAHTPASPTSEADSESQTFVMPSRRAQAWATFTHIGHILFPTLHEFGSKSILGKITAVFAAPATMMLTLTLPVVMTAYQDSGATEKRRTRSPSEPRLVDFEEEGIERTLIAEEEVEEGMHEMVFNKWLLAVQCFLGPLFCAVVMLDGIKYEAFWLLAIGTTGFTAGILVSVFAKTGRSPASQLARCAMGFTVAVIWIMAIADEVVKVLQTFGFIFGLSDAIIGITVFAIGNSLADLVANMSVAVFAPVMGFSACFGGPMLNILLGVGISGSYIVRQTGEPYPLHFSPTLVMTGSGLLLFLLATLVFVPLNGYHLPRSWGITLICAYLCLMVANIVVEVNVEQQ